jgi:hypoxanthine phosphoribosyltransferase
MILTISFGLISVLGIILSAYFYQKSKQYSKERFRYEWADIQHGVERLLRSIAKTKYRPDVIIHSAGSPAIVANLAMILLDRFVPIYEWMVEDPLSAWLKPVEGYVAFDTARWRIHIPQAIEALPRESRLLILDSTCMTGSTVDVVRRYLKGLGFAHIKFASLLAVPQAKPRPTEPEFVYFVNPSNDWYWPWAKGR